FYEDQGDVKKAKPKVKPAAKAGLASKSAALSKAPVKKDEAEPQGSAGIPVPLLEPMAMMAGDTEAEGKLGKRPRARPLPAAQSGAGAAEGKKETKPRKLPKVKVVSLVSEDLAAEVLPSWSSEGTERSPQIKPVAGEAGKVDKSAGSGVGGASGIKDGGRKRERSQVEAAGEGNKQGMVGGGEEELPGAGLTPEPSAGGARDGKQGGREATVGVKGGEAADSSDDDDEPLLYRVVGKRPRGAEKPQPPGEVEPSGEAARPTASSAGAAEAAGPTARSAGAAEAAGLGDSLPSEAALVDQEPDRQEDEDEDDPFAKAWDEASKHCEVKMETRQARQAQGCNVAKSVASHVAASGDPCAHPEGKSAGFRIPRRRTPTSVCPTRPSQPSRRHGVPRLHPVLTYLDGRCRRRRRDLPGSRRIRDSHANRVLTYVFPLDPLTELSSASLPSSSRS
ncbi:hypothetical protein CYMTET_32264, partial [Cymbomonas tetramitiformis]